MLLAVNDGSAVRAGVGCGSGVGGMINPGLLNSLTDTERLLVAETEPDASTRAAGARRQAKRDSRSPER